jgi:hypothetical protein
MEKTDQVSIPVPPLTNHVPGFVTQAFCKVSIFVNLIHKFAELVMRFFEIY